MLTVVLSSRGLGTPPVFPGQVLSLDAALQNESEILLPVVEKISGILTATLGVSTLLNTNDLDEPTVENTDPIDLTLTALENANDLTGLTVSMPGAVGVPTIMNVNDLDEPTVSFVVITATLVPPIIVNVNDLDEPVVDLLGESTVFPYVHKTSAGSASGDVTTFDISVTTTVATTIFIEVFTVSPFELQSVTDIDGFTLLDTQDYEGGGRFWRQEVWAAADVAAGAHSFTVNFDNEEELFGHAQLVALIGVDKADLLAGTIKFAHGDGTPKAPEVSDVDTDEDYSAILEFYAAFGSVASQIRDEWQQLGTAGGVGFVYSRNMGMRVFDEPVVDAVVGFDGDKANWLVAAVPVKTDEDLIAGFPMPELLYSNNLRNYANDAAMTTDGWTITGAGHATAQTTGGRLGSGGVVRATDDDQDDCRHDLARAIAAAEEIHCCFWVKPGGTVPIGNFFRLRRTSDGDNVQLAISGLTQRNAGVTNYGTGGALATSSGQEFNGKNNTWVHVEFWFLNADVNGRAKLWIDEVVAVDFTGDTSSALASQGEIEQVTLQSGTSVVGQMDFNDLVIGTGTGGTQIGFHYVDDAGVPHLGATP